MHTNFFKNKSILVTGASGSIGSEIVRKLLDSKCSVIRAMSNDENGIYHLNSIIDNENKMTFQDTMKKKRIRYLIGDVRDYKRNFEACENIDIVIHAAAMKHVPICEYNSAETHKTNVIGTKMLIKASLKQKVKHFLFISTDKAAKPTSIMGQSKLDAERIVFKSNSKKNLTKFSVIRFGNVIGSRGSVLLKFLEQIKNNQKLTITDRNVTRFFITINQATNEILNALKIMKGKELFIIKNMNAFKIIDLAKTLKDIFNYKKKIEIIGLRVGEKLHEELIADDEFDKVHFLNNSIENKVIVKTNKDTNQFRSDLCSHLSVKKVKKFLIKDFNLNIKKF